MRPSLHACGLLLLLGAGVVASAADSGVALESTKQELRQLEKDQKTRVGQGPAAHLPVDSSAIQLQAPGGDSPQQWLNEQLRRERSHNEQKDRSNWLVDGVEKLGQERTARQNAGESTRSSAASAPPASVVNPSDPHYLLKLFDAQKSTTSKDSTRASGRAHVATPDALAPYLREWLGASPVRGQFFDQFVKPSAGAGFGGTTATGGQELPGASGHGDASQVPPEIRAESNPYLVGLDAPSSREIPTSGPTSTAAILSTAGPDPGRPAQAPRILEPLPDNRPAAKGPPPGLADEKKYFPQLKKF